MALAAAVVFMAVMTYDIWTQKDETIPETQTTQKTVAAQPVKKIDEGIMPPESGYGIVVEKNLFSANRAEVLPERSKSDSLKISEKKIYLYGTVIMGENKQALITNPESGSDAAKKQSKDKWIKIGDTVGNFKVSDIAKDKIVLADGAVKHEILLYDQNKPERQKAVAQKPAAPTVVATGTTAPAAPASKPTPGGVAHPSAPAVSAGDSAPAGEYKSVKTPFGTIKRRIK